MKKFAKILGIVLLFAVLGYCREFFFVHLNNIMYRKYYNRETSLDVPAIMQFFERFTYDTLYYSKYPYTLLWTLMFFAASYFTVKTFTNSRLALKLLFFTYAILLVIAGLSMTYGFLIKQQLHDDEYTLSRWLLGIAQSPIICLILLASEKLYNNKPLPS